MSARRWVRGTAKRRRGWAGHAESAWYRKKAKVVSGACTEHERVPARYRKKAKAKGVSDERAQMGAWYRK